MNSPQTGKPFHHPESATNIKRIESRPNAAEISIKINICRIFFFNTASIIVSCSCIKIDQRTIFEIGVWIVIPQADLQTVIFNSAVYPGNGYSVIFPYSALRFKFLSPAALIYHEMQITSSIDILFQ